MRALSEIDSTFIYQILFSMALWLKMKRERRRKRKRGVDEEGREARLQVPQAVSLDSLHLEDRRVTPMITRGSKH